ncbi:MAG: hypothetical protein LUC31_02700 [Coprobacillus sp.]|nr:hypothetical protein [Coprobacillus sp.]
MKKSSLFLIVIIYIVSIVAITFFGQSIEMDQYKVYMSDIWISNESEIVSGSDNIRNINITFNDDEGWGGIILHYEFLPEDATDSDAVKWSLYGNTGILADTGEEVVIADIDGKGEVVFHRRGMVTAYVTTTDGSNLVDSVRITCR